MAFCSADGCIGPAGPGGRCPEHYRPGDRVAAKFARRIAKPVVECGIEGCPDPVEAAGMCAGHRGRFKKGKNLAGPKRTYSRTPFEGIAAAALKYADAAAEGSNEDFQKAKWRFKTALRRYFRTSRRVK